jgi:hypothetical protein
MSAGYTDPKGFYHYGEDDVKPTFSALLNLSADAIPAGVQSTVDATLVSNPTIVAAAAGAVNGAVAARDLVNGADPRLLTQYEATPGTSFAAYDFQGRRLWMGANDTDGAPDTVAAAAILAVTGAEALDVAGASVVHLDATGQRTWLEANDTDGGLTPLAKAHIETALARPAAAAGPAITATHIAPARQLYTVDRQGQLLSYVPDPKRLIIRGESHMHGGTGTTPEQRWGTILGTLLPGSTVTNLAVGGSIGEEAAFRGGALALEFTVANGTVPAAGAVTVTLTQSIRTSTTGPGFSFAGRMVGLVAGATVSIPGTIANVPATPLSWTFTRATAGDPVAMAGGRFISNDSDTYAGGLQIIGTGINDSISTPALTDNQCIDRAVAATVALVESQRSLVKRALLLGSLTRPNEQARQYAVVTGIHRELAAIYDGSAVVAAGELSRQYANQRLIYDMGIVPTAADLANMAADTMPASVTIDGQHLAIAAHPFYAAFVKSLLTSKGLI